MIPTLSSKNRYDEITGRVGQAAQDGRRSDVYDLLKIVATEPAAAYNRRTIVANAFDVDEPLSAAMDRLYTSWVGSQGCLLPLRSKLPQGHTEIIPMLGRVIGTYDIVIGVATGGYPNAFLAHCLGMNLVVSEIHTRGNKFDRVTMSWPSGETCSGKRVLILDDSIDSGDTVELATALARSQGAIQVDVLVSDIVRRAEYDAHTMVSTFVDTLHVASDMPEQIRLRGIDVAYRRLVKFALAVDLEEA